jgi:hypothetical protein
VLVDLVVTFTIALMVSVVFVLLLGWGRRPSNELWPLLLFLFSIIWFGSWTLGRWIVPFGPGFWGAPVLTFTFLALLIGFIIAAAVPQRRRTMVVAATEPTPASEATVAFGVFFWLAMLMLVVALIATY